MDMSRSYAEIIRNKIEEMSSGSVITIDSFPSQWPRNVITRSLSRLTKEGIIERVKKGIYSKTKQTKFGKVISSPLEILAKEIEQDESKCFGGLFLFNNLGLTTQVPNVVEILNNKSSYKVKLGETNIRYVRIRPKITKSSNKYIIFLEVLKNSKIIPDASVIHTFEWINRELKKLSEKNLNELIKISLDYPPRVRALLGSLFMGLKKSNFAKKLKATLNNNSVFNVGEIFIHLKDADDWRMKK